MNKKKLEAELITLGYNQEKTNEMLIQLDELLLFAEYMKSKYELTDEEYEKMYNLYVDTKNVENEKILMETVKYLSDEEEIVKEMTNKIIELSIEMLNNFAKLHGYNKMDEYKKASNVYINKLLKNQIVNVMQQMK